LLNSSTITALNRKSSTPPNFSGMLKPIRPYLPAAIGFAVDESLVLPLLDIRRALLLEELARRIPQLLVLGLEYQPLHHLSYLAFQTG
jgi:hypothetical protein